MTTERFQLLLAGIIEAELGFPRDRARVFASGFTDLNLFMAVPKSKLVGALTVLGKPVLRLSATQIKAIDLLRKKRINPERTISENYIAIISRKFALRQVGMIRTMNFETLSVNPLLVKALNIHTPRELVGLHVEMAASRSIVTSMGFYLEQLVWASSDTIEKAPRDSNWDFKLTRNGREHWLQIKSGPNDLDKDQISHWAKKIEEKISGHGEEAVEKFIHEIL